MMDGTDCFTRLVIMMEEKSGVYMFMRVTQTDAS